MGDNRISVGDRPIRHGSTTGYRNGCRCDECRSAVVQYNSFRDSGGRKPRAKEYEGGGPRKDGVLGILADKMLVGDGCWEWTGSTTTGYGTVNLSPAHGTTSTAHRVVYELLVGPIPDGAQLDHVCHTTDPTCPGGPVCAHRRCVNPKHLEPVTQQENNARAVQRRVAARAIVAGEAWVAEIDLRVGDFIMVPPREAPHVDNKTWWWRVTRVHDYGFDCVYERVSQDRRMTRVYATRFGVAFASIQAHRVPS